MDEIGIHQVKDLGGVGLEGIDELKILNADPFKFPVNMFPSLDGAFEADAQNPFE
jgi:hypothetical protein